ncbi:carbohydrate ABC transporter permease [Ructibacterium gallinarum]|uniref:Carbohydrate ABC transporter permease n=1 Tax=Ructibacterium gallinarum TaxID=2779355 RepID=A0A9D5M7L5_9FIRM|nr:carbohydrate ABC transporter permease [Ructibacterium gallinarum]MBE5041029.1 carbohydrate ABC transporter permease [Ructibacterium gallinarum]
MRKSRTLGEIVFDIFLYVIMTGMILIMVLPMVHVIMASFSNSTEVLRANGLILFPKDFNIAAYEMVAKNPNIFSGYRTTLVVVLCGTFLSIIITSLGAYVLSRRNLMWGNTILGIVMFTMFFSGGMIPFYLIVNNTLHLGNSIWALILPSCLSTWNLIVMRTSFCQIPDSLIESAQIDGANDFIILFRIVIPASMAIVAVMILFYGVSYWNSWFNAVLFIKSRTKYPLQLILREILVNNNTDEMMTSVALAERDSIGESIKYATVVVSTLPILCVYPFLQKYFVKGVMVGAVKG